MEKLTKDVIDWTKEYLNSFGGKTKAIIGISGGKDSSVAAAICVAAVGRDRVIGVMMPDGHQHDQDKARELIKFLGIKSYDINIASITAAAKVSIISAYNCQASDLTYCMRSNMPARVRMMTLYNIAAMEGDARVVNTCNKSEDYIGYSTKFGDAAGDFSPLSNILVRDVKLIGHDLGLPYDLVEKKPEDGLSGKTDEDNLGFTYAELDKYIEIGEIEDNEKKSKIDKLHVMNMHKLLPMPSFNHPLTITNKEEFELVLSVLDKESEKPEADSYAIYEVMESIADQYSDIIKDLTLSEILDLASKDYYMTEVYNIWLSDNYEKYASQIDKIKEKYPAFKTAVELYKLDL